MNAPPRLRRDGLERPFADPPAFGAAVEVAEGVLWARLPLPMALDHVNVYALDDGDGWTLIDSGIDTQACRAALEALIDGPLAGKPLRRQIATHGHPDHIGLSGWLGERGVPLLATRQGFLSSRMLQLDHQDRPSALALDFQRGAGWSAERVALSAAREPFNFSRVTAPLVHGYERLRDGDRIEMGGRVWRVATGEGHAVEQATFWSEDGALALTADQIIPGISPNIGVWATEPDADPLAEWFESCARFAGIAEPETLALPGHKEPFRGLPKRLDQLIENHRGALDRLRRTLAEPVTAVDCFPAIFRREIGDGEYGLATAEAVAHLNWLVRAGEAVRERRADGAWLHSMRDGA